MDFTNFDSELVDIHHIFSQKYCEEQGYDKCKWNWIVNKMLIAYCTNRIIGGVALNKYMKTIEDTNVSATALNANAESHSKKKQ